VTNRILDLAETPARLRVEHAQLVIERDGQPAVTVPIADLAVLIVSHPQVSFTHAVISTLAEAGGAFVTCDQKHLPVAMLLPLQAHFLQAERFARQARASRPVCKRLWQQIVRAKIRAQSRLLAELHGDDRGLDVLVSLVRSGDPINVEAQAARRYWPALFADPNFRRERAFDDQNRLLNWGYAILRAMVARAICAAGLHPSVGVQHHNRYNAFCLADDLMEPFRPLVDRIVAGWVRANGRLAELDRTFKQHLLETLTGRWDAAGEVRTLFDVLNRLANSLANVFIGQADRIEIPALKTADSGLDELTRSDGADRCEIAKSDRRRSGRLGRPTVDPLADVG